MQSLKFAWWSTPFKLSFWWISWTDFEDSLAKAEAETCFVWVRVYQSSPDFVYMFCLGTCLPVESRLCIHVLSGYVFTSRVQTLYTRFVWVRVYQSSPDFVYMFCLGTCLPVESRLCIHVLSGYVFTSRVQTLYTCFVWVRVYQSSPDFVWLLHINMDVIMHLILSVFFKKI